jgi:hypothetical protein
LWVNTKQLCTRRVFHSHSVRYPPACLRNAGALSRDC